MPETIIKYFNIHGLIRVCIESSKPVVFKQSAHQLAEFEVKEGIGSSSDIIIQDYDKAPPLKDAFRISDYYYYYADGTLNIPSLKTCFNFIESPIKVYCDQLVFPMSLIVHLVLLSKGYSLVHAAGVEFKGRRYLFPAFGGVGKTALTAAIIFAGGKLYGDDMSIVGKEEILSYPQDFSVYPYHLRLLKLQDKSIEKAFKKTAFFDRITNVLRHIDISPARVIKRALDSRKIPCVSVSPRLIFGDNCFASKGKINEIYYLRRSAFASNIQVTSMDAKELAKVCTNILLHELYEFVRPLYAYSALFSFSLDKVYNDTRMILENLFSACPCHLMEIPQSMSDIQFQKEIMSYLR